MRYVDLTVNQHVKNTFIKRTKLFNAMRGFNDAGYLEVETQFCKLFLEVQRRVRLLHHNSLDIPLYMRIANDLKKD
jgi:lysyl-tRNA synthetase class 2